MTTSIAVVLLAGAALMGAGCCAPTAARTEGSPVSLECVGSSNTLDSRILACFTLSNRTDEVLWLYGPLTHVRIGDRWRPDGSENARPQGPRSVLHPHETRRFEVPVPVVVDAWRAHWDGHRAPHDDQERLPTFVVESEVFTD